MLHFAQQKTGTDSTLITPSGHSDGAAISKIMKKPPKQVAFDVFGNNHPGVRLGAMTFPGGRYPQREVPEWPGGECDGVPGVVARH